MAAVTRSSTSASLRRPSERQQWQGRGNFGGQRWNGGDAARQQQVVQQQQVVEQQRQHVRPPQPRRLRWSAQLRRSAPAVAGPRRLYRNLWRPGRRAMAGAAWLHRQLRRPVAAARQPQRGRAATPTTGTATGATTTATTGAAIATATGRSSTWASISIRSATATGSYDIGYELPPVYYGQQYWIDPAMYELPVPAPGRDVGPLLERRAAGRQLQRPGDRRDPRFLLVEPARLLIEEALRPSRSASFAFATQISLRLLMKLLASLLLSASLVAAVPPPPRQQPAPASQQSAHDRLFQLFKESDEASLKRNPLQALYRGDYALRRPARRPLQRRALPGARRRRPSTISRRSTRSRATR